jgi:hypothetical protein
MAHDSEYCRRRAAEARSAAFSKDSGESVDVAGDLALAYAALARRRALMAEAAPIVAVPVEEPTPS